ncbi:MAG: flagellar basal-body rod protein FlgF [Eubacterium sp.]|nr:flagellar basal-body rod protein FlgF [Eubacterium sp.]
MLRGLYTGWTGMVNEQKRLDVVSHNLANADTLGYKAESVSSQAFDKMLTIKIRDGSQAYHNQAIGKMSLGVKVGETFTDYSQGSLRETGNTFDLALSGKGFFAIKYTNSEGDESVRYTRDGSFQLTKDGYLVDTEGNRVQGENGDIQIDPSSTNVAIGRDGSIFVDNENVDSIKVVDFEDYDYVVKLGDNMYTVVDGAKEIEAATDVLQGYTEQSNVNVVSEMVDMITITRAYDTNQRVMKSIDSMLDKAVNQVGRLGS